jgi:arylsulfatase A-like enzyme
VFSEAYPPQNVLKIMDTRAPHLIDAFQARAVRRAAYQGHYKLIQIEGDTPALYDLDADPREQHDLGNEMAAQHLQRLVTALQAQVEEAQARRPENWARRQAAMDDELLLERLRGLGYIE